MVAGLRCKHVSVIISSLLLWRHAQSARVLTSDLGSVGEPVADAGEEASTEIPCEAGLVEEPRPWQWAGSSATKMSELAAVRAGREMVDERGQPLALDDYVNKRMAAYGSLADLQRSSEGLKLAVSFFKMYVRGERELLEDFRSWLHERGEDNEAALDDDVFQHAFVLNHFPLVHKHMVDKHRQTLEEKYFLQLRHVNDYINWVDITAAVASGMSFTEYMRSANPKEVTFTEDGRVQLSQRVQINSNFVDLWRRAYAACAPTPGAFSQGEVEAIREATTFEPWRTLDPNQNYWTSKGEFQP
eukprot:TRINITY_DN28153_c0_g1_i1.p1 TRINITY_DN28153_c0_g1~~TRINITY_DN28153_c0_g1_i1.p1  ORF type:complete len:314 (+),score=81.76 TRINITY_DN28153_c0_g1_i1:40-942(+)